MNQEDIEAIKEAIKSLRRVDLVLKKLGKGYLRSALEEFILTLIELLPPEREQRK